MRREMNLIRMILEYVEEKQVNSNSVPVPEFPDYRNCVVEYHVLLCREAGYLDVGVQGRSPKGIFRMTWAGHEKLDAMRAGEISN